MKKLRVTVEGKAYEVLVEILDEGAPGAAAAPSAPAPVAAATVAPVAAAPVAAPAAATAGSGDVVCPLAGKLVSIDVKVGQIVDEGAQLATVEAMKMNTYIYAPKSGKVTEILAAAGEGVEEGMVLLRLA
jgi:glutaconyl-CoA/methylmalonyl-CoA decarboxylase subunit gamma